MRKPFKLYRKDEIPICFDLEQERINILSEEIAREIDREIITNLVDLVSVQPMSAPLGKLFYFDFVYTHPTSVTISYRTPFKLKRKKT